MNTRLGNGKVHAAQDGSKIPMCGGNRASERYRLTALDVDCKNCLKELEAQAAAEQSEDTKAAGHAHADMAVEIETEQAGLAHGISPEGVEVEITRDLFIDMPNGGGRTIRKGTRGTVVEVNDSRRSAEYLIRFSGIPGRDEWLFALEFEPVKTAAAGAAA